MNPIARYKQLSPEERGFFFRALLLMLAIRIALWTLPFRVTRAWVDWMRRPTGPACELERVRIRRVGWAVEAASRRIPRATCLTQSMTTQVMLGRLGQASELHLGVARKPDGQFEAHAWVETQGRVINGGTVEGFQRFVRLEKSSADSRS